MNNLYIYFPRQPVARDTISLSSPCNFNCTCSTRQWDPVCGANGITYVSACFAGCKDVTGTKKDIVRILYILSLQEWWFLYSFIYLGWGERQKCWNAWSVTRAVTMICDQHFKPVANRSCRASVLELPCKSCEISDMGECEWNIRYRAEESFTEPDSKKNTTLISLCPVLLMPYK